MTAFREGMAVHGRYREPCPVCGAPVQRIVYADNETNYCARCQTGGRLLADRALSRLLKRRLAEDDRRAGVAPAAGSERGLSAATKAPERTRGRASSDVVRCRAGNT